MNDNLTEAALERAAMALAQAIHGGSWIFDYPETQRQVWRNRVIAAMDHYPLVGVNDLPPVVYTESWSKY
jgi:hypothetical protein